MTCQAERIRIVERKAKKKDRLTTTLFKGKLFFGEKVRRPITRGQIAMISDMVLPITEYAEDHPWWLAKLLKVSRYEDNVSRLLAWQDEETENCQKELKDIADSFASELREHENERQTFFMSNGTFSKDYIED